MSSTTPELRQTYFSSFWPLRIVFASFFVFTLPLLALTISNSSIIAAYHLDQLFFITLGMTHFLITGVLYLQMKNVSYFTSSHKNQVIYLAVPGLIMVCYPILTSANIAAAFPFLTLIVAGAVRGANYLHWGRQSFGFLQLIGHDKKTGQQASRPIENILFYILPLAMIYSTLNDTGLFLLIACIGLLLIGAMSAAFRTPRRCLYLVLQVVCGLITIYKSEFYLIALAMHYVEYHVVMYPRIFKIAATTLPGDRIFRFIKGHRAIFYLVLFNLAGIAYLMINRTTADVGLSGKILLSAFDGLFLFHFFVESFVWRFSEPFYRESLAPLYFSSGALRTQNE